MNDLDYVICNFIILFGDIFILLLIFLLRKKMIITICKNKK